MIWPWSEFRRLEAEVHANINAARKAEERAEREALRAAHAIETLGGLLNDERARNGELVQTITDMKRDGFQPPPRPPDRPPEPDLPDEVDAALRQRPETSGIRQWAADRIAAGMKPDEVRAAILRGREDEV